MTADLLAKSAAPGRTACTLVQHTSDVLHAFDALFGGENSLTPAWLAFFRVDPGVTDEFLRLGRLAAFCHDWGKANDGFQAMLARRGRQCLRHEVVSAIVMTHEPVWDWLESSGADVPLALAAVVGHHLKAKNESALEAREAGAPSKFTLYWNDASFRTFIDATAKQLGLSEPVPDAPANWSYDAKANQEEIADALDAIGGRLEELDADLAEDDAEPRRHLLWAVRAALVCADSAGSGLPRNGHSIGEWIADSFFASRPGTADTDDGRLTRQTIEDKIITPRLEAAKIDPSQLNDFQRACGDASRVPERALLMAPCGSGKTIGAWQWIAARCAERPRRRAIFLYPTRGTATEGFRDYLLAADTDEAALVHGTADLDLDSILPDAPDDQTRLAERRLFALKTWPRRLISATVDQFLGFLQHGYGPTCHLPLLADSVVVCDEVHSYDNGLFSAFVSLLQHFDVPVLAMTATMLEGRRQKLLKTGDLGERGLTPFGGLDAGDADSPLRKAADHCRYHVRKLDNRDAVVEIVNEALNAGKRVLWVVNTVDRCQAVTRAFAESIEVDRMTTKTGQPLYCYHSRFRLVDRQHWHGAVVKAFKAGQEKKSQGVLAVTTQVCEMSLDLDADVVVTEICPGTSLVQRMGRCCRDAKAHLNGRTGEIILYEPDGDTAQSRQAPYSSVDLNGVDGLIATMLAASPVSQAWLEDELQKLPTPVELPSLKSCRFIESGPWAASGEEQLRDSDDLSRQALICEDVDGRGQDDVSYYRQLTRGRSAKPWLADGLVVPVPKKRKGVEHVQADPDLPDHLFLAIHGKYFKTIGFDCTASQGPLIC